MKEIIDALNEGKPGNYLKINGKPLINDITYSNITEKSGTLAFVDGGNNEIIGGSNFTIQKARTYYCVYENGKRIKQERKDYTITVFTKNDKLIGETEGIRIEIEQNDPTLTYSGFCVQPTTVAQFIRRLLELKMASQLPYTTVIDGDLEPKRPEEKEFITANICGLSKTSTLVTDSGMSAIQAVLKKAPTGKWMAKLTENTYFAKLHEKSQHVFRIDCHDAEIIRELCANAKDPTFLGYPYGLIEAHKMAKVGEQETQQEKLILLSKHPELMNHTNDAHDVLDNIC